MRRELHRRGLRYRVDRRPLPYLRRRADLVFAGARIAVFIDGCFWHGCDDHWSAPASNGEWWEQKVRLNQVRDDNTDSVLVDAGWTVVRAWEHEDVKDVVERIEVAVRAPTRVPRPPGGRS